MKDENDSVTRFATPANVSFSSRQLRFHNTLALQLWRIIQARLQSWRLLNQRATPALTTYHTVLQLVVSNVCS